MELKTIAIILVVIFAGTIISGCTRGTKNPDGDGRIGDQKINASTTPVPKGDNLPVKNTSIKKITPSKTPVSSPVKTPVPKSSTPQITSIDDIKKNAINVTFDELFRNNENYVGKIVYFRGEVFETNETDTNYYTLLLYITKNADLWTDQVWANNVGVKFVKTDIIDVWAIVKGLRSYTSSKGNEVTIPEVDPIYIELVTSAGV